MKADEGVAPVVAIALLIGLVAIAGALIGLSMFAALENAAGTPPDVRFQVSADGQSLYHAGGDVLPLKNLVFYDTAKKENVEGMLIKSGSSTGSSPAETDVWATGDKIQFGEGILNVLSIVGLDSRNRPALLYMGAKAMVLPVGDMVPDEWDRDTPGPIGVIPTPTPVGTGDKIFQQQNEHLTFGNVSLLKEPEQGHKQLIRELSYPVTDESPNIEVFFESGNSNHKFHIIVTVYDRDTGNSVFSDKMNIEHNSSTITIPVDKIKKGYVCHVTVEAYDNSERLTYRDTAVITLSDHTNLVYQTSA
ncbi:MAG: type IV pilin N-terminal domain-containing protein [Methanocorpusculum sp.]|nr:type IV pilin N-terminal domain-containing protein [Methanocorpusculum sp.]MDE2523246.1 type IV pilin N-terminal domain-containing protein [Methanocorpusculum sp.]MDE2524881.1 type IV pilin N-terminal domain-containing protein [Methanocorpusculum sp.]